jgi:hypothetical protein
MAIWPTSTISSQKPSTSGGPSEFRAGGSWKHWGDELRCAAAGDAASRTATTIHAIRRCLMQVLPARLRSGGAGAA